MIEIDVKRFKREPVPEQIEGVKHLVSHPRRALFDRPGVGKTKQIIDASCVLFDNGVINTVVVVAPSSVRGVWDEPELGELRKDCWVPYMVKRFLKDDDTLPPTSHLLWVIVSYGYLRRKRGNSYPSVQALLRELAKRKTWLVFDESSFIKSRDSNQFKAALKFSKKVDRISILNGTPVSNGVLDLWSQFMVLDPEILDNERDDQPMTYTEFRSRYCLTKLQRMGSRAFLQVVGDNKDAVDQLRQKAKPWILRRLPKGLPDKRYTHLEVELSPEETKMYCDMRDYLIAWIKENPSQASNGAVKIMRLAQITSGFIGGLSDLEGELIENIQKTAEIGDSKQRVFLQWLDTIEQDEQVIVWCRFRREIERLGNVLINLGHQVSYVYGGQNDKERQSYINNFQKDISRFLIGNPQSGGLGLNLINARYQFYLSNDFNLITRDQSEQRTHRRGQTRETIIVDCLAKLATGEKTIDYEILKSLREKETFANWTAEAWINSLLVSGNNQIKILSDNERKKLSETVGF